MEGMENSTGRYSNRHHPCRLCGRYRQTPRMWLRLILPERPQSTYIGNICMDMCMLDITGVDAKVGDTVTIFGEDPTVSELADILGTIPYEIMTSIPRRIDREIIR